MSGGNDGTLRLWDLSGRQIGGAFEGHRGPVESVAFSPTGEHIVSGSSDGTLRLWPGGSWPDWLYACSLRLLRHPRLTLANSIWGALGSDLDRQVCEFCQQQVWLQADLADFYQAHGIALAYLGNIEAATAALEQAQRLNADLVPEPGAMAERQVAVVLLDRAQTLAKAGEQTAALEQFAAAQALDPAIALDSQTRYNQLRAIGLIAEGHQQATQTRGDLHLTKAIAALTEAQTLDPSHGFDPQQKTYQWATPALVQRSQQLSGNDQWQETLTLWEQVETEHPALVLPPECHSTRVKYLAYQGQIAAALESLAVLQTQFPTFEISADMWNSLGWAGATYGYGTHPTIQQAAEQAVALADDDRKPFYQDTRGLCYALLGKVNEAIVDFERFLDWASRQEDLNEEAAAELQQQCQQRQGWIEALRAGKNPFTDDLLISLRSQ
ncbi:MULTISPECIES: hypothetical protein [Cyanophyceae]|uniref:hypothetical protein n=1 Tax=Cyanophyceae TaxID=3028117 RepID=UPI001683939F|nr:MULTISPECIES: hypothetical protein [unclassified Phormidium]MBD1917545.1 hypothetical protein [Phormidium sp. FACHB-77]MBD2029580.1 hypothetical protein [Phormidium sp. FACHB-322]MBD2050841.1 hypothetical protein [Leptolyngbya sp. FACHB-60]